MKARHRIGWTSVALTVALAATSGEGRVGQTAGGAAEAVAALKQSLQQSQANLRKYEWVETTIISFKGEEKSRKQQRCSYGADGTLQKLPLAAEPAAPTGQPQGRGRRGGRLKEKVVENKKSEMQEYMQRAAALIHSYVPPNPADIEKAKAAGRVAVRPGQGGQARVEFAEFLKPGDMLALGVDGAASRLTELSVASYLDEKDDAVTLAVRFGTLADGTSYAEQTILDAPAKHIRVVVENAGHRRAEQQR
jgi:hypothetical protein